MVGEAVAGDDELPFAPVGLSSQYAALISERGGGVEHGDDD